MTSRDISISVLIPTYNYGRFLSQAIDSVLAQTYRPVEIVVADDGSTDNTAEVVARYGPTVRYRRFDHGGVYTVRQAMLKELRGEWFLNLDADNWIEPDFLEQALAVVRRNAGDERFAFVYPDIRRFGEADDLVVRPDFDVRRLKHGNYLDMNSLIRTAVARQIGFDPRFNDGQGDYDFFLSLVEQGFIGARLPGGRLHYRVHAGSISGTGRAQFRHVELAEKILAKHSRLFSKEDARVLRRNARGGACNRMWEAVEELYVGGAYRQALELGWRAIRCDWRRTSQKSARIWAMALVVWASGGWLWGSRPVVWGEEPGWMPRLWRGAKIKCAAKRLLRRNRSGGRIWIMLLPGLGGRWQRLTTMRSVRMQEYRNWAWWNANEKPREHDWILPLHEGDELYPEALVELVDAVRQNDAIQIVAGDHAWWNGVRHCGRCDKPDWNEELFIARDYLYGPVMWRAGTADWSGMVSAEEAVFRKVTELGVGAAVSGRMAQVRKILMNRRVPWLSVNWSTMRAKLLQRRFPEAKVASHKVWFSGDQAGRVVIVIPTRDRPGVLQRCLQSLTERTAYQNHEIVVVDNGSRAAETREFLDGLSCRVLRHDRPFNYSELNNLGARAVKTPLILFLNDDTEIPPGGENWLDVMVAAALQPGVGVVGALLCYPCGVVQHAGATLRKDSRGNVWGRNLFSGMADGSIWVRTVRECSAVTGACQLVRREVFEAIGGYDETLPVVLNDLDFCFRARAAGWRVVYTPEAKLIHHEGISREGDPCRATEVETSRVKFAQRWPAAVVRDPFYRKEWECN